MTTFAVVSGSNYVRMAAVCSKQTGGYSSLSAVGAPYSGINEIHFT